MILAAVLSENKSICFNQFKYISNILSPVTNYCVK